MIKRHVCHIITKNIVYLFLKKVCVIQFIKPHYLTFCFLKSLLIISNSSFQKKRNVEVLDYMHEYSKFHYIKSRKSIPEKIKMSFFII